MRRIQDDNVGPGATFISRNPSTNTPGTRIRKEHKNDVQEEICRAIEGTGQAVDLTAYGTGDGNRDQIAQMVAHYAAGGASAYIEDAASAVNVYVIEMPDFGIRQRMAPAALFDGMTVNFNTIYPSTGPATLEILGLDSKPILSAGSVGLTGGELGTGEKVEVIYSLELDAFVLVLTNAETVNVKNYITNPSMAVSQENGDGPFVVPNNTTYYIADEWDTLENSNGVMTAERGELESFKSIKLAVSTAITDLSGGFQAGLLQQHIEARNIHNLNGKTITIAFKVRTNWTGKLSLAIYNSDSARCYITDVDVVSGINNATVKIPLEAATIQTNDNQVGLTIRIANNNEGNYQTAIINAWQTGFFVCSDQSTQWTKILNNFVEITAVGLYEGTVAPKFQKDKYVVDLLVCQVYYQTLEELAYAGLDNTSCNASIQLFVVPRTIPVVSQNIIIGTNLNVFPKEDGITFAATSDITGVVLIIDIVINARF